MLSPFQNIIADPNFQPVVSRPCKIKRPGIRVVREVIFFPLDVRNGKVGDINVVDTEFRLVMSLLHTDNKEGEFVTEFPALLIEKMSRKIPPLDPVITFIIKTIRDSYL